MFVNPSNLLMSVNAYFVDVTVEKSTPWGAVFVSKTDDNVFGRQYASKLKINISDPVKFYFLQCIL